jgi:hypothetical protein
MAYRGEDLDLRIPFGNAQAGRHAATGAGPPPPALGSPRDTTLWIDEPLLACCNNAFDLALAHGATEVRLEHLLHALSRVDAVVRLLERHGVGVGRLRRDSAALIVSETPVALISDRGPPRRSTEFEEALRRAAEIAQHRGAVAGVEEALIAILTSARDNPAVHLLKRLAPDWQPRDLPAPGQEPLAAYGALSSDTTDGRLDLIEGALRGIHAELAGDRKLLSDIVRDLQREVGRQRGDGAALSSALSDRLAGFERQLTARTEPLRAAPQIGEKLQSIEKTVQSGMGEGARNWIALDRRLKGLEAAIDRTGAGATIVEPIAARLAALEQALADRGGDAVRSWTALADRVQSLEKLYQVGSSETVRQWSALSEGNAAILRTLEQRSAGAPVDGGVLTERLELIEHTVRSGLSDTVRSNALLADRIAVVERSVASRNDTESAFLLDERMRALESALDGRAQETGGRWLELVERLKTIDGRLTGISNGAAQPSALTSDNVSGPILSYLASSTEAVAARDSGHARAMAEIGGRVAALEHVVQANAAAVNAAARVYDRNTDELHDGFLRLSENQHTLASAIGDWRDESTAEFRMIATGFDRLKAIEERLDTLGRYFGNAATTSPPKPERPMPAAAIRSTGERAEARHLKLTAALQTFWRWLVGTDGVAGANRAAKLKWQQMRDEVRSASARLRKKSGPRA